MKIHAAFFFLALAAAGAASAEETNENFEYKTVTTPEGLTFRVPEDMPIENRGGIQAPIPFDEYAYGKFAALTRRLARAEERIARLEKLLEKKAVSAPATPKESALRA